MGRISSASLLLLLLATCPARAEAPWALNGWNFRRAVELTEPRDAKGAAHVGFAHGGQLAEDGRDLRITNAAGAIVDHELMRLGPGDRAEALFEAKDLVQGARYYVYFGNARALPPKAWTAEAGVVMEVRKKGEGDCQNWAQFQGLFRDSKELVGRTLREQIFDGYNPLGPDENFVSYYRAYFHTHKDGDYGFATNSDDASFLAVNGRNVTDYPGWHGAENRHSERNGTVRLKPGVQKLEYWHVQGGGGLSTTAAWRQPGEALFSVMPPRVFVPVARAQAGALERADGKPALDFSWTMADHLVLQGRYEVRCDFECRASFAGELLWDFGDGSGARVKKSETGFSGRHVYIAPGTYRVTLKAEDSSWQPSEQTVVVEPNWNQRAEWDDGVWQEYRPQVLRRLADRQVRPEDAAATLAYAAALEDDELLKAFAQAAWDLEPKLPPGERAKVFFTLALELQGKPRDYAGADRAFRVAGQDAPDPKLLARARLHHAGLLIHIAGRYAEAQKLLDGLAEADLAPPTEPTLAKIYRADALAGLGRREEAAAAYAALRTVVPLTNRLYATQRRGRLLSIASYIERGDHEAALQELANIEWETPLERMTDETGLLRAQCYLATQDYARAAVLLERLLNMNPTSARVPEMLLKQVLACKGLKQPEQAKALYARMKREYPYAAETAWAKMQVE
ncbi:MAG: PKD domain-containing protein [Planctomycetota bacterium]|nr:PKD domain-containing protein [Planctomycetota bacterium]